MNKNTIFGLKGLRLTTPKAMQRLGMALAAAGTAGAGIAYIMEYEKISLICLVSTILGTFISQMYGEVK